MANIRQIKKNIDFSTSQVVVDCFQYIKHVEKADEKAAYKIIKDILGLRADLRKRVNHPDSKDNSVPVKKHFNTIGKDLLEGCDKAYEKLGQLVGKEK